MGPDTRVKTAGLKVQRFPEAYETTISWSSSIPTTVPVWPEKYQDN